MRINWKKAVIAASVLALGAALPPITGDGSAAYAHTSVSGSVVIGGPTAVFGFSYGDPFVHGHVHYRPGHCSLGPLYYFPAHGVYAHYYPSYRYYRYYEPVRIHPGQRWGHHKHHRYYTVEPRHGRRYHDDGHGHARGRKVRGHRHDD